MAKKAATKATANDSVEEEVVDESEDVASSRIERLPSVGDLPVLKTAYMNARLGAIKTSKGITYGLETLSPISGIAVKECEDSCLLAVLYSNCGDTLDLHRMLPIGYSLYDKATDSVKVIPAYELPTYAKQYNIELDLKTDPFGSIAEAVHPSNTTLFDYDKDNPALSVNEIFVDSLSVNDDKTTGYHNSDGTIKVIPHYYISQDYVTNLNTNDLKQIFLYIARNNMFNITSERIDRDMGIKSLADRVKFEWLDEETAESLYQQKDISCILQLSTRSSMQNSGVEGYVVANAIIYINRDYLIRNYSALWQMLAHILLHVQGYLWHNATFNKQLKSFVDFLPWMSSHTSYIDDSSGFFKHSVLITCPRCGRDLLHVFSTDSRRCDNPNCDHSEV